MIPQSFGSISGKQYRIGRRRSLTLFFLGSILFNTTEGRRQNDLYQRYQMGEFKSLTHVQLLFSVYT